MVSHFVFFVFLLFNKIRENKRKIKENKIETKSLIFNSNTPMEEMKRTKAVMICPNRG